MTVDRPADTGLDLILHRLQEGLSELPGLTRQRQMAEGNAPVELGRAEMPLKEVLTLGEGSVVSLDRLTDELLDLTANGRVVARGEVVAQDGRFALRIVEMVGEDASGPINAAPTENAPDEAA